MKNPPAFQFYPADYLADMNVRLLSWASKGLYMDLICYCWREGYIPSDSSAIAMLCGCHDLAIIEPCLKLFTPHPDDPAKLVHLRLIEERQKQIANAKNKSEGGKKGAESRWNKGKLTKKKANGSPNSLAIANPLANPMAENGSSSSSSSSSSIYESSKDDSCPTASDDSEVLTLIWSKTPGKGRERSSKKLLETEWRKLPKKNRPTISEITDALNAWAKSEKWLQGYAEGIHLWVKNRQWENIPEPMPAQSTTSRPMTFGARPPVSHYLYKDEERAEIPDA